MCGCYGIEGRPAIICVIENAIAGKPAPTVSALFDNFVNGKAPVGAGLPAKNDDVV